jgi:hypothetical protein
VYRWYTAQVIPQIDAEIVKKGHFWMETNYNRTEPNMSTWIQASPELIRKEIFLKPHR